MKNTLRIMLACMLAVVMVLAGCTTPATSSPANSSTVPTDATAAPEVTTPTAQYDTLVVANAEFNGIFSPFFYTTSYDKMIWDKVHIAPYKSDRLNNLEAFACEYKAPELIKDADGKILQTVYTFTLKDGITFSDGTPVTSADMEFAYLIECDPTYDGLSTTGSAMPIVGVNEYRYDDPDYEARLKEITAASEKAVTDDMVKASITEMCTADVADAEYLPEIIELLSFDNKDALEGDALAAAVLPVYIAHEMKKIDAYRADMVGAEYKKLIKEYVAANLAGGTKVPTLEGVKIIDEKTITVTINGIDPTAELSFGSMAIAPRSYYAKGDDGKEYVKGDLSVVKSRDAMPMGAGPYKFVSYENNVVSMVANDLYFEGAPLIPNLNWQVVSNANKLDTVTSGDADLSDPNAKPATVKASTDAGLAVELVDNNGYGYIGINAKRIADKNVRKGLMSLLNRKPAVDSYYGDLATIIERPMTRVSWAYPQGATAFYEYSLEKALAYFTEAGYVQTEEGGKKMLKKDGVQLRAEFGIPADGTMDHPSGPIVTQLKLDLESLGGLIEINDCGTTLFFDKLNSEQWDMWAAAWGGSGDPDMYQLYHTKGSTNYYKISTPELDTLIEAGRNTLDKAERTEIYAKALDLVMDEAVEMPVYQRKNMYVFAPDRIDMDSVPKEMSPFYYWEAAVQTMMMK